MRLSAAQIVAIKQGSKHCSGAFARIYPLFSKQVLHGQLLPQSNSLKGGSVEGYQQRGFTLVELITVMVIVGIVSAIALPRMFERGLFDSRGYYDQVISSLRYAQKTAISQRRTVCVTFPNTSRMVLETKATFADIDCKINKIDLQNPTGTYPAGQTTYTVDAPSGVTLSGTAEISFDALGRATFPGVSSTLSISVSGFAASNVCIARETGYVYGRAPC